MMLSPGILSALKVDLMKQQICKVIQNLSFGSLMIMETGLKLKLISFKQLGLFFLLLSLQLHLLLALPQNSVVAADLNHPKNIGREPIVPKKLSLSVKLGGQHEIKAVGRRGGGGAVGAHGGGGAVGAHGGGGAVNGGGGDHGSGGVAAGDNGGGTKSPNGQSGAVIPVYAAGAMNQNRYHHHGSGSGTIHCIGSSCLVLILFTSFFFVYYSI